MPRLRGSEEHLTPAGEAQWARLRRHLEMADGFWLAFVFARSPGSVHTFEQRTEQVLRLQTRRQVVFAPATPEELATIALRVLELANPEHPDSDALGCIWIEAIFADSPGEQDGRWTRAWEQALLALNQARQPLRNRLSAGLAIAAPEYLKPSVRAVAPDLWSIRTLVLDLPTAPGPQVGEERPRELLRDDRKLTLQLRPIGPYLGVFEEDGSDEQELRAHVEQLRQVARLTEAGRSAEAVELGNATVARARALGRDALLATTLATVGSAEEADGDAAAASQHFEEAIDLVGGIAEAEPLVIRLLGQIGQLELALGNLSRAIEALQRQGSALRTLMSRENVDGEALRALSISLTNLGDARRKAGDLTAATTAYEESLTLDRRLLDTHGETPQTLRDLAISLTNLGDARREAGDLTAATTAYEESLAIRRRLINTYGETPQSLRDLSVSLDRLGDARQAAGELAAATTAYEESLTLDRRLLDNYGETPQTLRDLSISLNKLGKALEITGDLPAATALREEARALEDRRAERYPRDAGDPDLGARSS
jgi:tetratricopeptide (TPR) repeat protein